MFIVMNLVVIYLHVSMHMVCMHACVLCVFDSVWVHMDMCIHVCVRQRLTLGDFLDHFPSYLLSWALIAELKAC